MTESTERSITPTQANMVLGVFFDEMERRNWSTSVSDVTAAQQATLTHFRHLSAGEGIQWSNTTSR